MHEAVSQGSSEGLGLCVLSLSCGIVTEMPFPCPVWSSQLHPSLSPFSLKAELVSPTTEVTILQSSSFFGFPMKKQSSKQQQKKAIKELIRKELGSMIFPTWAKGFAFPGLASNTTGCFGPRSAETPGARLSLKSQIFGRCFLPRWQRPRGNRRGSATRGPSRLRFQPWPRETLSSAVTQSLNRRVIGCHSLSRVTVGVRRDALP